MFAWFITVSKGTLDHFHYWPNLIQFVVVVIISSRFTCTIRSMEVLHELKVSPDWKYFLDTSVANEVIFLPVHAYLRKKINAHYYGDSKQGSYFIRCCFMPFSVSVFRLILLPSTFIAFECCIAVCVIRYFSKHLWLKKQVKVVNRVPSGRVKIIR